MRKIHKLNVEAILNGTHGMTGKDAIHASLAVLAWEAKQRGETEIELVVDTGIAPYQCCNPPILLKNHWET
jgi:hypothetical protein